MFIINNNNKGVINMNNLKKVGLSALAGSLVAFSANAGEMTVSGSASLSMSAADENAQTTWSSTDHVDFTGSGELDNGMIITYKVQLDGDEADNGVVDNNSITIDTAGSGVITYAGHGGSSVMGGMDDKTPNAYEEAWDSLTQTGTDSVINGAGGNDLIRYDSPSFSGVQVHASVTMNAGAAQNGQYNDFGITVKPEMVEGLELGYAFGETEATAGTPIDDSTMYVKYAFGPVTVGYQESESDAASATNSDESSTFGISYQVSDEFSVSYNTHEYNDGAWTSDEEYTGISASYTMGGITIGGHMNEVENRGGDSTAADVEGYELNVGFAF